MRFILCNKCKYNFKGECEFYIMGSGNDVDKPCRREEELVNRAANYFIDAFSDFVDEQPTIDAVEVVRCRDCKWHMDKFCNKFTVFGFNNDDFCSLGERRKNE